VIRRIAIATVTDLRRNLPSLIGYEVLFRILLAAALAPLTAWVLTAILSMRSTLAISNEEIARFLLSPLGLLALVFASASALATLLAQGAGIMFIVVSARQGTSLGPIRAVMNVVKILPALFKLAIRQFAVFALLCAPLLVVAVVTATLLLSRHDINYYLHVKPPSFWLAASIGGLVLLGAAIVGVVLYLRWLFAVPLLLFEGASPRQAMRDSRHRLEGRTRTLVAALLVWLGATLALGALGAGLVHLIDNGLPALAGDNVKLLIPAIAVALVLELAITGVVAFLSFNSLCLLIARLYLETRERPDVEVAVPPKQSSHRLIAWSTAGFLLVATVATTFVVANQVDVEHEVDVTAHRGSARRAPENTLSAVRCAIEDGADYAEIDVQETADGTIVVLHDADLMRVASVPRNIWDITSEELKGIDAGSWFAPGFAGEPIPTLQEVIDLARGRIRLNIELKFNGHDERLVERVVEIIRRNEFQAQCILMSLHYEALLDAKRLDPSLVVGFTVGATITDVTRLDVDFLSVSTKLVTPAWLRRVQAGGKQVHVWTVNDPDRMLRFLLLGVDNIISDEPATVVALREKAADLTTAEKLVLEFRYRLLR
jgi:glycerophosphoryl diester phosphodiesterase